MKHTLSLVLFPLSFIGMLVIGYLWITIHPLAPGLHKLLYAGGFLLCTTLLGYCILQCEKHTLLTYNAKKAYEWL